MNILKNIKIKLLIIIFMMVAVSIAIAIYSQTRNQQMEKEMNRKSCEHALNVSMQVLEDSMENIEHMLVVECQKDADIKKILNPKNSLERYLSMQGKKDSFAEKIQEYQYLDGIFLYDKKMNDYVGVVGNYVTSLDHRNIKSNVRNITEQFDQRSAGNQWHAYEINQQHYLLRIMRMKKVYVCVWMKPEHIMSTFNEAVDDDIHYILCDEYGKPVTESESFEPTFTFEHSSGKIEDAFQESVDLILYQGEEYHSYSYKSTVRPFVMSLLVKNSVANELWMYVIFSIAAILLTGIIVMFLIYKVIDNIIIDPIQYILLKEKSEKDAVSLQFLQMQLNPHFINNCLSLIRNLIVFQKYDDAEHVVITLSDYTRNSLQADTTVTVKREIEHLKAWIDIQEIRRLQRIHLHLNLESGTEDEMIPTMLIHTFAENTVKYYDNSEEPVEIYVQVKYSDENRRAIDVTVRDEGPGYPEKILEQIRTGQDIVGEDQLKHIGISNIMKRVQILYGDNCNIDIGNVQPHGAIVHFLIPVRENGGMEG